MTTCTLYQGDCLETMRGLPTQSIHCAIADLPYGYRVNKWDMDIDMAHFWTSLNDALAKSFRAIFTCDFRLGAKLFQSAPNLFRHDLIWHKEGRPSGHLNAKKAPLRSHETILVFGSSRGTYNPQMIVGRKHSRHLYVSPQANGENFQPYAQKVNENLGTRFPKSVQTFSRVTGRQDHPTQKPTSLMEWLIKTYTNEGDTVLDPVFGSATTAVACARLGRHFIGIEKDPEYFRIGTERVNAERAKLGLGPAVLS